MSQTASKMIPRFLGNFIGALLVEVTTRIAHYCMPSSNGGPRQRLTCRRCGTRRRSHRPTASRSSPVPGRAVWGTSCVPVSALIEETCRYSLLEWLLDQADGVAQARAG